MKPFNAEDSFRVSWKFQNSRLELTFGSYLKDFSVGDLIYIA